MNPNYLDFEQPITELNAKIESLRLAADHPGINIAKEITHLQNKSAKLTQKIFSNLSDWQIVKLSRHPLRPYTLDYIKHLCTEFTELHGDRSFADDPAIICGLAKLNGLPVCIIGHQKGREVEEKVKRNFGMPRPEGYRKAQRIMKMAEQFNLPIITLIDTPGAYPGINAEERGQSEAIAKNLETMSKLSVPIIATVIGEGGSGGALAIGLADKVFMLEYATYAVISPEGCASILWKSADKAPEAAAAMGLTAKKLLELELIDGIIPEPQGGAHRNPKVAAQHLEKTLSRVLMELTGLPKKKLVEQRFAKLAAYGT